MVRRCNRCVLPDTIPKIQFDGNGICNYCNDYVSDEDVLIKGRQERGERLGNLIKDLQAKRGNFESRSTYDVLVPLSGGRDSSYVAWALTVKEGLKILCVNYDNPFSSRQAQLNVDRMVEVLGVDIIKFTWPHERHERSFKNNLKAWLRKPDLGTTGLLCLACKPFYLKFYQLAKKNKINLIIDGSNPNEATQFKLEARAGTGSSEHKSANALFGISKKVIKNQQYIRPCNIIPAIHTLMSADGHTRYLEWRYSNIEKHGYFYCNPYDEKEINATLKGLGWEQSKDNKSPWRFDCEIDSVKNYLFRKLVGATEKEDLFSKNIRAGLLTREEASNRLEESEINLEIVENVLRKIGMKLSDLEVLDDYQAM